ncbi:carbon-nitrogen hydrolase family protein [Oceanibacterium hippocampi]|uniref:Aliphatic amidase n=1 Tax=Oceanibacterium hippocampi TaxID=745714 RepID=A0A1Y5TDH3_9PROT|nr:carbon-nitrogen hydrolase family protein [Oceanibacterium hippocampi]SLN61555.1 Aliphatic amidase [Oceanibacterium hippocampi]
MVPFAIAGIQMQVDAARPNVEAMIHKINVCMARFPWVQMIIFSELAPFGPLHHHAQSFPPPAEQSFAEAAARHGIWLIPGSIFERTADGRVYNTASVIDPQGTVVARYRKMFPFLPYEAGVSGGTEFCVFDVPGVGRFGLSNCYDMWFPETTRTLTSMGAEVLLRIVLTGTTDREVELAMAQATAAQFQCFVFDINGLGAGGVGRSRVVDPSGQVLYQAGEGEEIIPLEIDLERVRRQRETGANGLGQVLKSFRDRAVDFPVYRRDSGVDGYLGTLGPLTMPARGSRDGLAVEPVAPVAPPAPVANTNSEVAAVPADLRVPGVQVEVT